MIERDPQVGPAVLDLAPPEPVIVPSDAAPATDEIPQAPLGVPGGSEPQGRSDIPGHPGAESSDAEDHAATASVASVVAPSGRGAMGRSRTRWIVAGGVAALATAGAIAAAVLLGARPLPEALRYLPADSVVVVEARPELPGDQRQNLGNLLANFPGFADQSVLTQKLDETFDRIVSAASNGSVDYAARIKPLLAGPMVAGVAADGITAMAGAQRAAKGLVVATTDGSVSCGFVFGTAGSLETFRGVDIESVKDDLACALDGSFMLIGDVSSIRAGIDAHLDGAGVDTNARFTAARERLEGDQLGLVFVDGKAIVGIAADFASGVGVDTALISKVPDWVIVGLRVIDDAVQIDVQSPPVAETDLASTVPTDPPPATSRYAALLPADTLAFVEAHGVGANLQRALAILKADPNQTAAIAQLEQVVSAVGGMENVVGWVEDLGLAAIPTGDSVGGVVLIRGTDAAAVSARLAQLRNLLILASTGTDITVNDSEHAGVTITNVDLGDLGSLLSGFGVDSGISGVDARLSFTLAAKNDVLMLAVGDGVIERVLDTTSESSLGTTGAYQRVISLTGSPNDAEVYVAIDGLLGFVESNLPAGVDIGTWIMGVKPYLEHVASFGDATVTTGAGSRSRLVITVK
ncbi:MAG: DUF3352 domain-containing protein [Chloroflexi bacterium]|nr:DUF3352 domain-containing protein [Chloroflexota bacterium]